MKKCKTSLYPCDFKMEVLKLGVKTMERYIGIPISEVCSVVWVVVVFYVKNLSYTFLYVITIATIRNIIFKISRPFILSSVILSSTTA